MKYWKSLYLPDLLQDGYYLICHNGRVKNSKVINQAFYDQTGTECENLR